MVKAGRCHLAERRILVKRFCFSDADILTIVADTRPEKKLPRARSSA
jgi:hypothetical protein